MRIEDFELIKPISKGAFGSVYIGVKRSDARRVRYAIKVMDKGDMVRKNMLAELAVEKDIMAQIDSKYIVQLYYCLQTTNKVYFVMEFCIGGDVCSMLCCIGYFEEPEALYYLAQVIFAVSYLHQRKIIHRDIKPENMLITAEGRLKLSDFGLSAVHKSNNSQPIAPRMTPNQSKSIKEKIVYGYKMANTQTPALLAKPQKSQELLDPIPFELSTIEGGDSQDEDEIENAKRTREMLSSDSVILPDPKKFKSEETGITGNFEQVFKLSEEESSEEISRGPVTRSQTVLREHNFATPMKTPVKSSVHTPTRTPKRLKRQSIGTTPRRTPRRTSRGQSLLTRESLIEANILGSPDYMPPELLNSSSICMLSDVWAVGVCFFEFLTGIPPFNDSSPEAVFENIKSLRIDWPVNDENNECLLSEESQRLIKLLLKENPYERPHIDEVITQQPFNSIMSISNIDQMMIDFDSIEIPFVPGVESDDDTTYFKSKHEARNIVM